MHPGLCLRSPLRFKTSSLRVEIGSVSDRRVGVLKHDLHVRQRVLVRRDDVCTEDRVCGDEVLPCVLQRFEGDTSLEGVAEFGVEELAAGVEPHGYHVHLACGEG